MKNEYYIRKSGTFIVFFNIAEKSMERITLCFAEKNGYFSLNFQQLMLGKRQIRTENLVAINANLYFTLRKIVKMIGKLLMFVPKRHFRSTHKLTFIDEYDKVQSSTICHHNELYFNFEGFPIKSSILGRYYLKRNHSKKLEKCRKAVKGLYFLTMKKFFSNE